MSGVTLSGIQQEVEQVRKTLGDLKTILDQLDKARSVVCEIDNVTDTTLTYADSGHDHGGFGALPEPSISPRKASAFGSQSSSGSLFTGTQGWVRYVGTDGVQFTVSWDNPWAGSNSCSASLDGNLAHYICQWIAGSGDQHANMRFILIQIPFAVYGAIRDKWMQLGNITGLLGLPTTDESGVPDGVGRFNHFTGGSIYWRPEIGAHEVHGAIREKWLALRAEAFGYPLDDETGTPDGVGRYNHFRAFWPDGTTPESSIYWTPQTGAHEVHGAIRAYWQNSGWEQGHFGYPTSDESDEPDGSGRFNTFQHGTIHWRRADGQIWTS